MHVTCLPIKVIVQGQGHMSGFKVTGLKFLLVVKVYIVLNVFNAIVC